MFEHMCPGYAATGKLCVGELGSECETSSGCGGNNVCDTNTNSATCALGSGETCDATESKCMTYSECIASKCTCTNGDADETTKLCPAPSDESCGSTTVCANGGVCDTNSDTPTCAIGSGGTCVDANSKCVAHSECKEKTRTCINGDANETKKLCPSPSGGLRKTSSMLVVTVCLWLSLF